MIRHLTFGVVSSVVRCGCKYGVFPKCDLAENSYVALGRRPFEVTVENPMVTFPDVRLSSTTPLFWKEIAHTFAGSRTLAHARDACPSSVSLAAGTGQEATLVAAGLRTLQHRSRLAKAILESVILTVSLDVW